MYPECVQLPNNTGIALVLTQILISEDKMCIHLNTTLVWPFIILNMFIQMRLIDESLSKRQVLFCKCKYFLTHSYFLLIHWQLQQSIIICWQIFSCLLLVYKYNYTTFNDVIKYKITMKYTNINVNNNHIIPQELD